GLDVNGAETRLHLCQPETGRAQRAKGRAGQDYRSSHGRKVHLSGAQSSSLRAATSGTPRPVTGFHPERHSKPGRRQGTARPLVSITFMVTSLLPWVICRNTWGWLSRNW